MTEECGMTKKSFRNSKGCRNIIASYSISAKPNTIHQEWSDLSVKEHKNLKGLKTENLSDHMSDAELVFTALAELSTRQIAETMETKGLEENKIPARKGDRIAKNARKELENKTGKKVVSKKNYL